MKSKSKKLFIFSILTLALCLCPFMRNEVHAAVVYPKYVAIEKEDGNTRDKYVTLEEAVNAVQPGETIKILDKNFKSSETVEINGKKNIKFDFAGHSFKRTLHITNSDITFLSGIYDSGYSRVFNIENSIVTFDGGDYKFGQSASTLLLGSNSMVKFKNGTKFTMNHPFLINGSNSNVIVEDAYIEGNPAIDVSEEAQNNTITVGSEGILEGSGSWYAGIKDAGKHTTINLNGAIKNKLRLEGEGSIVNLNAGSSVINTTDWSVEIAGENNTINFNGATVEGGYGGVLIDSSTTTVNVENSTIKGTGRHYVEKLISPAIVAKNVKNLNIISGTITGELGIVAYNGNVNISGGNISATNANNGIFNVHETSNETLGEYQNAYGAAVIIDNKDGDSTNAKANITGGVFNSKTDASLVSTGNKASDYAVSGGTYNKPFNEGFVVPNELELKINNEDTWYVGDDARKVIEDKKNDAGTEIEVLHGDVTIIDAATGLKVKNSGNGKVVVNEVTVEENQEIIVEPAPEKQAPTTPSNPDVNGDQDDVPNTGVENPQTGDGIITYIIMGTLSLLGLAGITTKRLILNKR